MYSCLSWRLHHILNMIIIYQHNVFILKNRLSLDIESHKRDSTIQDMLQSYSVCMFTPNHNPCFCPEWAIIEFSFLLFVVLAMRCTFILSYLSKYSLEPHLWLLFLIILNLWMQPIWIPAESGMRHNADSKTITGIWGGNLDSETIFKK